MKTNGAMIVAIGFLALLLAGGGYLLLTSEPGAAPIDAQLGELDGPRTKAPRPDVQPDSPVRPISTSEYRRPASVGAGGRLASAGQSDLALRGSVRDAADRVVSNAQIDLFVDVSPIKNRGQEGELVGSQVSNAEGGFEFVGLIADERYVLRVSHEGFATTRRSPIEAREPATLVQIVKLDGGIGFQGRVSDKGGAPVAGARVTVYDLLVQAMDPDGQVERVATTGSDGTYQLAHLNPGSKKVVARKPGLASDGREGYDLKAARAETGEQPVVLDFVLDDGYRARGHVKDASTGEPVVGALITARPMAGLSRSPDAGDGGEPGEFNGEVAIRGRPPVRRPTRAEVNRKGYLLETCVTDERGDFVLEGLIEARYQLLVRAKGYQPHPGLQADAGSDATVIELKPSASIAGRVVDEETGQPVTAFSAAASPNPSLTFAPASIKQRFQSEQGAFEYVDVRSGTNYLLIEAEGYAPGRSEAVLVEDGQRATEVVVRLGRGAKLTGRVVTSEGTPVRGAEVSVEPSLGEAGGPEVIFTQMLQGQMRGQSRLVRTDANGAYVVSGVPQGPYVLRASHPDYASGSTPRQSVPAAGEVVIPDILLPVGSRIRGVVVDAEGVPDAAATVMVSSAQPAANFYNRSFQTDARGQFEASGLVAGSYRVVVSARKGQFDIMGIFAGRENTQNVVTIGVGETLDLNLPPPPPGAVSVPIAPRGTNR